MDTYDVIIVGGGLAGLTAALHLRREMYRVAVFERQDFPHHKVCGEYVSNEIVPYVESLGVVLPKNIQIDSILLSTVAGKSLRAKLPLGGLGISRFTLDKALYDRALAMGVVVIAENVLSIVYGQDSFEVGDQKGNRYNSRFVLGAYGKRDALDKRLDRYFTKIKSPWLAVKAHYKLDSFPDNIVGLHNFKGGYAGLSKTESGAVNFCYLTSYASFKKERGVDHFNRNVVARNPFLSQFLNDAETLFDSPLTIGQISFDEKRSVEQHVIMCGDTAGLIHPFCGNGMAMAIHSAKIASELLHRYFKDKDYERRHMEKEYAILWKKAFGKRLWAGRQLQSILLNQKISGLAMAIIGGSPYLTQKLIESTHGEIIERV
ncbi:MAG TPA: NAD(P)/FAD-dependent oxidoreductase [Arenibacter sp.]|nr:NAD(P)/FAD-dependent oxidoreductase [Arenibacter sp.]